MEQRRWDRWIALALALLLLGLAYFSTFGMIGGSGVVLNATTEAPVQGAKVVLECSARLLHGYKVLKEVTRIADANGRFSYGVADLWRCDFAFVDATMDGYVLTSNLDPNYSDSNFRHVPPKVYLTPLQDERMQQLKYHAAMSQGQVSDPKYGYFRVYQEFANSENIARTAAETAFVRTSFCNRLDALNTALSDADRDELRMGSQLMRPVDHDARVRPYCDLQSGAIKQPSKPVQLRMLDSLFARLLIQLTIPQVTITGTAHIRALPEARVTTLKLESKALDESGNGFRPLTSLELASVGFRQRRIRLRGQAGIVVVHTAANGEYFTLAEMLAAIEATELASREQARWSGGVDVEHIDFAFLRPNDDGTWTIVWH